MPKNFRPRVIEPANAQSPNGVGVAVEIEFHEKVEGLDANTIVLHLGSAATMAEGERLCDLLSELVTKIALSR